MCTASQDWALAGLRVACWCFCVCTRERSDNENKLSLLVLQSHFVDKPLELSSSLSPERDSSSKRA